MLGEMWETKQFSKVLQNSLKVIYLQQTTKKLLHFQPFALSREEIQFFSWFSRVLEYLFCEISISKLSENGSKLYIIYRVWWKYWNWYLMEFLTGGGGGGVLFLRSLSEILKIWLPMWRHLPKNVSKMSKLVISSTNVDRKMKIKSKMKFEVKYLFMKLFFRNREILATFHDVIFSKLG